MPPDGIRRRSIRWIEFARRKYGRELLVDAGAIAELPGYIADPQPHRLRFHDILVVTAGSGRFWLDDRHYPVEVGRVFFTRPGQVRRWQATGLAGICLFFMADFLTGFMGDPRFLERFSFFRDTPSGVTLRLGAGARRQLAGPLDGLRREVRRLRGDSEHLIQAWVYESLALLERFWVDAGLEQRTHSVDSRISKFVALVEERFRRDHRLASYAGALHLTTGHLNELSHRHLGDSAGRFLRRRLVLEAKRQLAFTDQAVKGVGRSLGFVDAAYFCRFFRREVGSSPLEYRAQVGAFNGSSVAPRGWGESPVRRRRRPRCRHVWHR